MCGFNRYTLVVIIIQIVIGLLTGLLLRNADAIIKSFAVSVSLLITCIVDVSVVSSKLSYYFLGGMHVVVLSVLLYSGFDPKIALYCSIVCFLLIDFVSSAVVANA